MRDFKRPLVVCIACKAKIFWGHSFPVGFDEDTVDAKGPEPPRAVETCPRCNQGIDTTVAYPAIAGFPPSFEALQRAYEGFVPSWEYNRKSFEAEVQETLKNQTLDQLVDDLNTADGFGWYRQRMFYRSCTAFYRSYQLFLAFLVLERRCFPTWSKVTGYYSRFFFVQALLNLVFANWDSNEKAFFYFDGTAIHGLPQTGSSPTMKGAKSHEVWWQFMEALKHPSDYPIENLEFILSRLVFNPSARNSVNYGFEYLRGGFIELDWFDSGANQMMSHFMPQPRTDADITDHDRFFADQNPENYDEGDFYGDDAQILWCSLKGYLKFVKTLGFTQEFIQTENLAALAEIHLSDDYPTLMKGILLSAEEILGNEFDVEAFMAERERAPDNISSFWGTGDSPRRFLKSRLSGHSKKVKD